MASPRSGKGQIDFFYGTSYFWFQNLLADIESFSKYYNKVHFSLSIFRVMRRKNEFLVQK